MAPAVSVIIPTWNRRAMVREAIASVRVQTGVSFELIVVDDGSLDETWNDLQELAAAVPRHSLKLIRTPNCGPAAARNRGADHASAPMIAFLDSDDLWSPRKLARQLAFMRDNPGYAICQTQETWMRGGRQVNPPLRHRKRPGDIFVESLRLCLLSPSAVMMRTELFRRKGGFDETMAACEDYDLWLRILVDHEAGLLDETLVTRRAGHPAQLSSITPALDRFRILALAKLLAFESLTRDRRSAVTGVLAEKCRIYAKGLKRRSRIENAQFFELIAQRALSWRQARDQSISATVAEIRRAIAGASNPSVPVAEIQGAPPSVDERFTSSIGAAGREPSVASRN